MGEACRFRRALAPRPALRGRNSLGATTEVQPKEAGGILDLVLDTVTRADTCNGATLKTNYVLPICERISASNSHVMKKPH